MIGGVRDLDKMEAVAEAEEFDPASFTAMRLELASFQSVREFCDQVEQFRMDRPIDRFVPERSMDIYTHSKASSLPHPSLPLPSYPNIRTHTTTAA